MSDDGELYPRNGGDRVPIFERGLPVQSISATTRGCFFRLFFPDLPHPNLFSVPIPLT